MSEPELQLQRIILFKDGERLKRYCSAYTPDQIRTAIADCYIRYGADCNATAVEASGVKQLEEERNQLFE